MSKKTPQVGFSEVGKLSWLSHNFEEFFLALPTIKPNEPRG